MQVFILPSTLTLDLHEKITHFITQTKIKSTLPITIVFPFLVLVKIT